MEGYESLHDPGLANNKHHSSKQIRIQENTGSDPGSDLKCLDSYIAAGGGDMHQSTFL